MRNRAVEAAIGRRVTHDYAARRDCPNGAEWQYYLEGQGRMTVFASSGVARTFDHQSGDVGYVPFAMGHYVGYRGDEPRRLSNEAMAALQTRKPIIVK